MSRGPWTWVAAVSLLTAGIVGGCSLKDAAQSKAAVSLNTVGQGPLAQVNGVPIPSDAFRAELEREAGGRALELLIREELVRQRAPVHGVRVEQSAIDQRLRSLRERDPTVKMLWEGQSLPEASQRRYVSRLLLEEALARRLADLQGRFGEPLQTPELLGALREGTQIAIHDSRYLYLADQTEPVTWRFDQRLLNRDVPQGIALPKDPAAALRTGVSLTGQVLPPASALRAFAYALVNYDYQAGLQGVHQVPRTLREQFFYGRPRPAPGAALREGLFEVLDSQTPGVYLALGTLKYSEGGLPRELRVWVRLELLDFAGVPSWKVVRAEPR